MASGPRFAVLGLLTSLIFSQLAHAEEFPALVRRVPSTANAIVLVDAKKIFSSPAAMKNNWKQKQEESYSAGLTFLPPDADKCVLASHMDFHMMTPLWETAIMDLDDETSIPEIAKMTGGINDTVGPYPALDMPGDSYLVQFGPKLVAAMAPSNRQEVGRWVRDTEGRKGVVLSPYLTEAFNYANELGTPVIMAMDLQDTATVTSVRAALASNPDLAKESATTLDNLAKFLSTIRGITLGLTLGETQLFGKVKVDFEEDVKITPEMGKKLLLHALAKRGAMLNELPDWTPKVSGKSITLEGNLTSSGVRRLSSLFARPPSFKKKDKTAPLPPPPGETPPGEVTVPPGPTTKEQLIAQSSKTYFSRIQSMLGDLSGKYAEASTMGQVAMWYDMYARKIDQLPVANVDPELAQYGSFASNSLRAAGSSIKAGNSNARIAELNVPMQYNTYTYGTTYGYSYRSDAFGSGYVPYGTSGEFSVADTSAYNHARILAKETEVAKGGSNARDIMSKMQSALADIRIKMSQKYGINF